MATITRREIRRRGKGGRDADATTHGLDHPDLRKSSQRGRDSRRDQIADRVCRISAA